MLISCVDPDLLYAAHFGLVTAAIGHLLQRQPPLPPAEAAEQLTELCFGLLNIDYQPAEVETP